MAETTKNSQLLHRSGWPEKTRVAPSVGKQLLIQEKLGNVLYVVTKGPAVKVRVPDIENEGFEAQKVIPAPQRERLREPSGLPAPALIRSF